MRRFLAIALFVAPLMAQVPNPPVLLTMEGGVVGTQPTQAQMNAGVVGCPGTGAFNGTAGNANYKIVTATNSPAFPAPTQVCGTPQLGNGSKVLQYTAPAAAPFGQYQYVLRSGSKNNTSIGIWFCADFDQSVVGGQYSNVDIITNAGANQQNILLGPNPFPGGLSFETNSSFATTGGVVAYHGGNCLTDPTLSAWRYATILYASGAVNKMQLWDAKITTMLGAWTGPNPGLTAVLNPGITSIGISGGEAETAGVHLYFKNELVDDQTAVFPLLPATQLWTGILDPARAANWTTAGVTGGIPDATWTQCGATITPPSSTAAINAAIAACSTNTFVLLGPGTFTLSSQLVHSTKNVVLRGSGANSTFLVKNFSGSSFISVPGSTSYTAFVEWTGGYAQGTSQITVASVPGGVGIGSIVRLDQCDDGTTGDTCAGTSTDNGALYNCSTQWASPNGCSVNGPSGTQNFRWQREWHIVSGVSGTTITLQDPILAANWSSGQTPHAQFLASPLAGVGLENFSVDATGQGASAVSEINMAGARDSWITGVRVINSQQFAIGYSDSDHLTVQSNYVAFSQTASPSVHGFARANFGHTLTANNIVQGFPEGMHNEQAMAGNVDAYNFIVNMFNNTDLMGDGVRLHGDGGTFNLWEGNITNRIWDDVAHGINRVNTRYRNFLTSWESCANGQCGAHVKDSATNGEAIDAFGRYDNLVGEVVGTPTFSTTYKSTSGGNGVEFSIGTANGSTPPADSLAISTGLFWGNYDVVTGAVRWCGNSSDTGWSTTCASTSEVPTAALAFPSAVPTLGDTGAGQAAMPPSFFLTSKPSYFQSLTWPPIGPDVASGNIGQCGGSLNVSGRFNGLPATSSGQCAGSGLNTAWGGHVNAIPAMNCFLNVMGGVPDGTGLPLNFDANTCYVSSGAPFAVFSPVSPLNLGTISVGQVATSGTVTLTNTGTGNFVATAISLGTTLFSLVNNTCGSPATITSSVPGTGFTLTPSSSCTFQVTFAPVTPGFTSGDTITFTDNSGNPDRYFIQGTSVPAPAPATTMFAGNITLKGSVTKK